MNINKVSKIIMIVVLLFSIGIPQQNVKSTEFQSNCQINAIDTDDVEYPDSTFEEAPKELSDKEFQKEQEEIYRLLPGYVVLYDLKDPKGIDPNLLPTDIASLVDSNTKVVEYYETAKVSDSTLIINPSIKNEISEISCKTADGSRTSTVSTTYGKVTQYSKVYALRYDDAAWNPAQPLSGWEFEKQWAMWSRTDTTWYVNYAKFGIESSQNNDFCTGSVLGGFYYSSSSFDPQFYGSATSWQSISGFPNRAYVPSPYHAIAYTQGDIKQGSVLKYSDAKTRQYFSPFGY